VAYVLAEDAKADGDGELELEDAWDIDLGRWVGVRDVLGAHRTRRDAVGGGSGNGPNVRCGVQKEPGDGWEAAERWH